MKTALVSFAAAAIFAASAVPACAGDFLFEGALSDGWTFSGTLDIDSVAGLITPT